MMILPALFRMFQCLAYIVFTATNLILSLYGVKNMRSGRLGLPVNKKKFFFGLQILKQHREHGFLNIFFSS